MVGCLASWRVPFGVVNLSNLERLRTPKLIGRRRYPQVEFPLSTADDQRLVAADTIEASLPA